MALQSRQQSALGSIKPQIVVGTEFYLMRPTLLMTNRWKGCARSAGTNLIHYRYKFDFKYNAMGNPQSDSALSDYTYNRGQERAEVSSSDAGAHLGFFASRAACGIGARNLFRSIV